MAIQAHDVTARDGTGLNLWEQLALRADEAVLYVHGGITCARALFSPPVPGERSYSWLAASAHADREAFALDIRGYGESDLPAEMTEPPERNGPPVRADLAADDIADAYSFIRKRYETIHLVGVSWGTVTCGRFVERDRPDIASLTLCAPIYRPPYDIEDGFSALGLDPEFDAYYYQHHDAVEARLGMRNSDLGNAIWTTQLESNQGTENDAYIAQTGALADYADCCDGDPPYDASDIRAPTLVIRGSADVISQREDAAALYDELAESVNNVAYTELAGADHYIMHGDRRQDLYDTVTAFHDRV